MPGDRQGLGSTGGLCRCGHPLESHHPEVGCLWSLRNFALKAEDWAFCVCSEFEQKVSGMQIHFETQNLKLNLTTGEQCKKTFSAKEGLPPELVPISATLQGHIDKKYIDQGFSLFGRILLPGESAEQGFAQQVAGIVEQAKKDGLSRDELTGLLRTALEFCYGDAG